MRTRTATASGGVLLEKRSAAPGLAPERDEYGELVLDEEEQPVLVSADPRWVGSGRVVLDNKGNPVRGATGQRVYHGIWPGR